jgi:RNA polymerase sigma factor (sigma-70 family)
MTTPGGADADIGRLCAGALAGDQGCWNEIVGRYTRLVWSIVRGFRLADADAADVHQTTFLKLVENLPRIEKPGSLASWMATTARNESLRVLRRQGRVEPSEDALDDAADPGAAELDAALLADERDSALWSSFRRLRHRCQELLRLLMADPPVPYDDISRMLGIPVGSIGPTRQRCLRDLRTDLAGEATG